MVQNRNDGVMFDYNLILCYFNLCFRLYCTVEEPDLAINMYKKHRQVNFIAQIYLFNR